MAGTPLRLVGPAQLTAAAATIYTTPSVPAGFQGVKTVVRHLHVQNPSGSTVTFTLSIGTDAAGKRLYDAYSIAAGQVLDVFCYYALAATEILQAFAGTASVLVITIDGDVSFS